MKKFNIIRSVHLALLVLFLLLSVYLVFFQRQLFHRIAQDADMKLAMTLLWACFGLDFLFLILDFRFVSEYKRDYRELDYAVHTDPQSGLANRNSCDAIIERYADKPLPPGVGCVMVELSNIRDINARLGHAQGNAVIRDFSNLLKMASVSLCFVGRNGGNKFLAIFEQSDAAQVDQFLQRLRDKVDNYNRKNPDRALSYRYGIAFDEPEETSITRLVALADRRIGAK